MKRTWIGAGLLVLLLVMSLLVGTAMESRICPGAEKLRQAADAAHAGDWEKARQLTDDVLADWDDVNWLTQILTTHEDLEQIEMAFAQLAAYEGEDSLAYCALCTSLARQLESMGMSHGCSWENFF